MTELSESSFAGSCIDRLLKSMRPVKCVNRLARFHLSYPAINCGCSVSSSFRSNFARDPKLQ